MYPVNRGVILAPIEPISIDTLILNGRRQKGEGRREKDEG
jgi:hypothetical protein